MFTNCVFLLFFSITTEPDHMFENESKTEPKRHPEI